MNITDVESDFIATGLHGIMVSWAQIHNTRVQCVDIG